LAIGGARSVQAETVGSEPLLPNQNRVFPDALESDNVASRDRQTLPTSTHASDLANFVVAGADNFNPGLQLPPPQPENFNPPAYSQAGATPGRGLEKLLTDFRNDHDNFGQHNRFIEETAQFRLESGDIIRFKTGFNSFEQRRVESVSNIPIQVGWEKKIGNFNVRAAAGVDVFDRLSASPNLDLEAGAPILPSVTLTGVVEQGAYKANAQTLENHISAWRLGPNIYWQIDRDTSFFALYRWGSYSDGNTEQQSFSRLERKFGQFSIAANLFTWSFEKDAESRKGYFSPPDFLVYSGEIAWQGNVFEWLRCRAAVTLGRQRLKGDFSGGNSYQALCTAKLSPSINKSNDKRQAVNLIKTRLRIGESNLKPDHFTVRQWVKHAATG
jgi:hypothetical protein